MRTQSEESAVGYVVSTWPRLSQTFVLNEILALERQGLRVRIFSAKDPGGEPVHADVGRVRAAVTYLTVRRRWVGANLRMACTRPRRYGGSLLEAMRYRSWGVLRRFFQAGYLADLLRRRPVSHLHAHFATAPTLVAMFASRLTGIPYSFTAHARDIYVDTRPTLLATEIERAKAVVTISEYNRAFLADRICPAANGKLRCIYNGLDLERLSCRTAEPAAPRILSVGRLVEKKGLRDLVAAAEILRRRGRAFQLEIVGHGPLAAALQSQVEQSGLGDRVQLLGALARESVLRAYGRARVFALPCIVATDGDRDGIPTVLLEAMALGVPVVSTPVSGIPELVAPEREGLLVPQHDPVALADALERLLGDADLRQRLARAARQKIEAQFSIDTNSRQLMALFQAGVGA